MTDDEEPPKVRIELPTWLTALIVVLALLLGGALVMSIADNASDARQSVEERY